MDNKYTSISIDQRGVATLTLNRPGVHNAFDDAMIAELIAGLDKLAANPALRVLILKANGKNFSAGADLNWMRSMAAKNYQQNLEDAAGLASLMHKLDTFPCPVIGLVQGAAFGGALGLIACCDIAIAEQQASFCLSEVRIGLIPAVISPYVLRAIGERASRRYFLTAERFSATEALSLGLLHEISPDTASLEHKGAQFAEQLLQNSPAAQHAAKLLLADIYHQPLSTELINHTSKAIAEIRVSAEGQEGLTAFLQKRQPAWLSKDN